MKFLKTLLRDFIEARLATGVARPKYGYCPGCGARQIEACLPECKLIDPYEQYWSSDGT